MECKFCKMPAQGKFCQYCGAPLPEDPESKTNNIIINNIVNTEKQNNSNEFTDFIEVELWSGQPAGIIDKALNSVNLNGIHYKITNQRIIITDGIIGKSQEEIELHKIRDFSVSQNIVEKMSNVGSVTIYSIDRRLPTITIRNIPQPIKVKDIIREAMIKRKNELGIKYNEYSTTR